MAGGTATPPFTWGCHAVFWRTGCVGRERICGGGRRHSEPEASPEANGQGRWDCAPSTVELAGKTAVEATTRTAKAGTGEVGGGADAGLGEAKDTGCGERGGQIG